MSAMVGVRKSISQMAFQFSHDVYICIVFMCRSEIMGPWKKRDESWAILGSVLGKLV